MTRVRGQEKSPGEFRHTQNWIGAPGCLLNDASYVPPPVDAMEEALSAFEKYLHRDDEAYPPLIRLAYIHSQFEMIHPFIDGNGRIGRLLVTLLLVSWNLLPMPLLYLSAYFERERTTYYDLPARGQPGRGAGVSGSSSSCAESPSSPGTRRRERSVSRTCRTPGGRRSPKPAPRHCSSASSIISSCPPCSRSQARHGLSGSPIPRRRRMSTSWWRLASFEPYGDAAYARRFWAPKVLEAIGD